MNRGFWPFKISVHTPEFHCWLYLSDNSYNFTAKTRPKTPSLADFFASINRPCEHMDATRLVKKVSEELGCPVYRQPFIPEKVIKEALSSPELKKLLKQFDFKRVQEIQCSPAQLDAIGQLSSINECAADAVLFRKLITLLFQEACVRQKDFLEDEE